VIEWRGLPTANFPGLLGHMDAPEPTSTAREQGGSVAIIGRILFWLGAGFCTLAAPWMLGGQPLAAQWWLLWGGIVTFIGGLAVRLTTPPTPGSQMAWRAQAAALVIGLCFVVYLYLQARNPSLHVIFSGNLWILSPVENSSLGPHSIDAPFGSIAGDWLPFKNAWRYLLIFGLCWTYAAGLALGLVQRIDARRWAYAVGLNAAALAVVCLVHRAMGERLTLWHFSDTVGFTGSPVFFYKNHNGAYLAALLAITLGLAWAAEVKIYRRFWEFVSLALWIATVAVNSRAATGFATLWAVLYLVLRWRKSSVEKPQKWDRRRWLVIGAVVVVLAAAVGLTGGRKAIQRFAPALSSPLDFAQGGEYRGLLRKVGLKMWLDEPIWGWGGGSYLYLFNTYQVQVPQIAAHVYREQPNLNRFYMVSADSDWVEFLVEYGAVGLALLSIAVALLVWAWWRWRGWTQELPLFLALGTAGIVLHGYLDHVLRNPALLILLSGSLIAAVRLAVPRGGRRHGSGRFRAPKSNEPSSASP